MRRWLLLPLALSWLGCAGPGHGSDPVLQADLDGFMLFAPTLDIEAVEALLAAGSRFEQVVGAAPNKIAVFLIDDVARGLGSRGEVKRVPEGTYPLRCGTGDPHSERMREQQRTIRDRLFVGAHAGGSTYWALAALGFVWAAVSVVLGNWSAAVEGILVAMLLILLVRVISGPMGWRFWPWR